MPIDTSAHYELRTFSGSRDTLRQMREHCWGEQGEKSFKVRQLAEAIVRDVWGKDYLSEILAIRAFASTQLVYRPDPLHVELIKTPERIADEVATYGKAQCDCDEVAEMIACLLLCIGRYAEFAVVGFGHAGDFSHVFARGKEPKSRDIMILDPVAGQKEREMADRVTTYEIWSLDEWKEPMRGDDPYSLTGLNGWPSWPRRAA